MLIKFYSQEILISVTEGVSRVSINLKNLNNTPLILYHVVESWFLIGQKILIVSYNGLLLKSYNNKQINGY